MYQVVKRDGALQDFDRTKISAILTNVKITGEKAERVLNDIEAWLPSVAVDNKVASLAIKEKLVLELRKVDTPAALAVENYTN